MFPEAFIDPSVDLDQRYTLRETDLWCRAKAGVTEWDLDVAASHESHLAPTYFTDNGLNLKWTGRVWCNPPFSDIESWVRKAWREYENCELIGMLLPANRTEQPWFQSFVEPFRDRIPYGLITHFLPGRTKFGHPGNPKGVGVGSPPFACVLLVWRHV